LVIAAAISGIALQLAGLALFVASVQATRETRLTLAFDNDLPTHVTRIGPYRWVRHPFYLSYILFWVGCACAAPSISTVTTAAVLAVLYLIAAIKEERKFASSEIANEYNAYKQRSGLLWPKPFRLQND
jgi:protein-S-isoprenylcysteine O-methyltransferase Ste14